MQIYLDGDPQSILLRVYGQGREVVRKEAAVVLLVRDRVPVAEVLQ